MSGTDKLAQPRLGKLSANPYCNCFRPAFTCPQRPDVCMKCGKWRHVREILHEIKEKLSRKINRKKR